MNEINFRIIPFTTIRICDAVASVDRQDCPRDAAVEVIIGNDGDISHRDVRAAISEKVVATRVTIG